ncbi:MAG TPA: EF-hand domain-containing protein [Magnetospirillum sp.]|jgi:hypothetical protein|nr:EF-hand domain-containing protein [Magnetospirillum sp.]
MPPQQKMSNLFDNIDSSGSGSISQAQFDQAFQNMNPPAGIKAQGADAIWSQLDPSGTGSVSKSDFVSTMKNVMAASRGHHHHHSQSADPSSTLSSASQGLDSAGSSSADLTTQAGSVNILV